MPALWSPSTGTTLQGSIACSTGHDGTPMEIGHVCMRTASSPWEPTNPGVWVILR
jgi:hypothetical protein